MDAAGSHSPVTFGLCPLGPLPPLPAPILAAAQAGGAPDGDGQASGPGCVLSSGGGHLGPGREPRTQWPRETPAGHSSGGAGHVL